MDSYVVWIYFQFYFRLSCPSVDSSKSVMRRQRWRQWRMLFEQSKYDSDAWLRLFSIGHTLDSGGLTYSFAFLRFTFIPIDRSYFMEIGSRQRRRFSKCSKFSVWDNVLFDGLRPSATDWVDSTFFPSAEKILGSGYRIDHDENWFLDALNCMAMCHNVSSR